MNAVIARVLDCFYLMEHSMLHPYKFRDCKNTVFCISNMQKTVFFQSLRMIFKKKIHFWGITECSKQYFSNSCIDHFKTKVAWIHHNIQEILLLPSLHLSPPYLCSKVSICQVVWLSGCHVVKFDPWDMLNNFCFHVYAQKYQVVRLASLILGTCWTTIVFMSMHAQKWLFIAKNCNAFFWHQPHHPPLLL